MATYFHSVLVITDRQVLDKQLQDAIKQQTTKQLRGLSTVKRIICPKAQLANAMLEGTPIIICTLQTFPHAQSAILSEKSLRDRRFAIIIDEAHSSTGA